MDIIFQPNIDRIESLLEILSDIYDYTIKRHRNIEAEPRYRYDEETRKAKRQELYKLMNIESKCLEQYHYWNDTLKHMKNMEQLERAKHEN